MKNHSTPESQNSIDASRFGAVILCGGKSTRLGATKAELHFGDKTFLQAIVDALRPICGRIVLVGNVDPSKHQLPDDIEITSDQRVNHGPLEGIRVGLESLSSSCEHAFVTSCDVPLLTADLVHFLFSKLQGKDAIVPVHENRRYGMTAIYRTSIHQSIDDRIEAGKLRVSELTDGLEIVDIDAEELRQVDPELDTLTNINSAKDYLELLARMGFECDDQTERNLNID